MEPARAKFNMRQNKPRRPSRFQQHHSRREWPIFDSICAVHFRKEETFDSDANRLNASVEYH